MSTLRYALHRQSVTTGFTKTRKYIMFMHRDTNKNIYTLHCTLLSILQLFSTSCRLLNGKQSRINKNHALQRKIQRKRQNNRNGIAREVQFIKLAYKERYAGARISNKYRKLITLAYMNRSIYICTYVSGIILELQKRQTNNDFTGVSV